MAPRPAGEADKIGNRYELAWIVRHALHCIHDDRLSLTVEEVDVDLSIGSEFTVRGPGRPDVHQLKRQSGGRNGWTVRALGAAGVLTAAASQVAAGRRFRFSSLIPCGDLADMADKARRSADLPSYLAGWLNQKQLSVFDVLVAEEALGSPERVWTTLRGTSFEVHGETEVRRDNAMLAERSLSGATGSVMAAAIGDVILNNLGRELTRTELLDELAPFGIRALASVALESIRERVTSLTTTWHSSISRGLLTPPIRRPEAQAVTNTLGDGRTVLVLGGAGSGKSAVLAQAVSLSHQDLRW